MSQFSHEMRRRGERRTQRQSRMPEDARRTLARDILERIQERQSEDPDISEFDAPLATPLGPLETYLLRHQRKEVLAKVALNRAISVELNEQVEPPVLHIALGDRLPGQK